MDMRQQVRGGGLAGLTHMHHIVAGAKLSISKLRASGR
jgi:hypothetical protein